MTFGALTCLILLLLHKPNAKLKDNQQMEFFQALKEFAPGRISKRYAEWGNDAWVVLLSDSEIDPEVPRSKRLPLDKKVISQIRDCR